MLDDSDPSAGILICVGMGLCVLAMTLAFGLAGLVGSLGMVLIAIPLLARARF